MSIERGEGPELRYFSEFLTGKDLYSALMVSEALGLLDYGTYEIDINPTHKPGQKNIDKDELVPVVITAPAGGADYLFEILSAIRTSVDFEGKTKEAQMDFIFERIAKVNENRIISVPR